MTTLLWAFLLLAVQAWSSTDYYGASSTEALLKFNGAIEVETSRVLTLDQVNGQTAKGKEIQAAVNHQLEFLIGHFQSETFIRRFRNSGVLGDQYRFQFTKVDPRVGQTQVLYYSFVGKTVFDSHAFTNATKILLPVRLPRNPHNLYLKGKVNGKNKCTDEHYDSEGDFFYFWDPDKTGCPLKGNKTDVLRIEGQLEKIQNTTSTYPEFDRLYLTEELKVSVFLGYIDDSPYSSRHRDDGYASYKEITKQLKALGYVIKEERTFNTLTHAVQLEKTHRNQLGKTQKVIITMLLSDSATSARDGSFVRVFGDALKNAQIIAYDGHSGLGGNLEFERFGIGRLPAFYQIFFFNGCSSYPYFNSSYFNQKPAGRKNLEIITAGLPTITSTSVTNMIAFLNPFVTGKIHSYQTLIRNLENSNLGEGTYLMGVNGDEDNKFRP